MRLSSQAGTLVLGNRTAHHDDMGPWTPEEIRADLTATSALIRQAAPHAGTAVPMRRRRAGITPGAVVLTHDRGGDRSRTVEAVDRIIAEPRAERWRRTPPRRRG